MANYEVRVAADDHGIVLAVEGDLDAPAGRHLLELARVAAHSLRRAVCIDIGGVSSCTPGVARLLSPRELQRLGGGRQIRTRGLFSAQARGTPEGTRSSG